MTKPQDYGDGANPTEPVPDPNCKQFRVFFENGSNTSISAFRIFTSYDQNLGSVVRALRQDETEVGVFYAPLGWILENPEQWSTPA